VQLLEKLGRDPDNTVVIVSGRKRDELDEWLGDLPLAFAAEHGFWRKTPGEIWQTNLPRDTAWQTEPRQLMEQAVADCPGSFLETKHSGVVWHYRNATDATAATARAAKLLADLQALQSTVFTAGPGSMNVEVQLVGANKGAAVRFWLSLPTWDFVLVAGDDRTDEDMFAVAPEDAFTVKVGTQETAARYHLADPAALRDLLARCVAAG
jgi:trehalose 6-phosphate synthase/phosphatase